MVTLVYATTGNLWLMLSALNEAKTSMTTLMATLRLLLTPQKLMMETVTSITRGTWSVRRLQEESRRSRNLASRQL